MSETASHIVHLLPLKMALIGGLGIGAQWLAWKLQKPAIVLMALAGLIFGPLLGYLLTLSMPDWLPAKIGNPVFGVMDALRLNPIKDFGDLLRPVIGISVAIILFEGGLTLKFREIQGFAKPIRRMLLVASPISWLLGACAAHYIVKLPWDISAMIGGLFVVTGPTVIVPLLRQAHLAERPANVLKWEGIVNDPMGALFAVGAYEFIRFTAAGGSLQFAFGMLAFAAIFGTVIGIVSGWAMSQAFNRGIIPEYLKAPVMLVWVLLIYVFANEMAEETGLLAVTAMGITMANSRFASLVEMRRFKENIAVLLVSGVFVILTATLTPDVIKSFFDNWQVPTFVLVTIFLVRPIAVFIGTAFSGLNWKETLIVSLIAPRGIVAVAVAGFFATELVALSTEYAEQGNFALAASLEQGAVFVPLSFALVFATVLFSSFTVTPLAKALGLATENSEGVLIVGANPWSLGLAKGLKDMGVPVTVADTNWRRLRGARQEGHYVFYGEVLSEHADYNLDHSKFQHLIAATPNDAYNSLVCVEFAPELGRHRVFQLAGPEKDEYDKTAITFTARGRILSTQGRNFDGLTQNWWGGYRFRSTKLSEEYTLTDLLADRGEDTDILMIKRADGFVAIPNSGEKLKVEAGSTVLTFGPVRADRASEDARAQENPNPSGVLPA
ncbi:cation:proton antiporter [Robiginitomaculum antarcticum]|uniref:cation:proton antiporter n=1 Tax=Robiginitomaculum antarcticum TaxID=437507 RepID=UPI00037A77AA|nr:cation:proton antiporter [Robiginitomaculum antarcticum]